MLYLPNIHFIFKSEHLFCSKLSTFVVKESSVIILPVLTFEGFSCGSVVKNPPAVQEMQETQFQSLGREDPLEEGMATHSSILAWRIPWREEPGRLQSMSMELQRVGHN